MTFSLRNRASKDGLHKLQNGDFELLLFVAKKELLSFHLVCYFRLFKQAHDVLATFFLEHVPNLVEVITNLYLLYKKLPTPDH